MEVLWLVHQQLIFAVVMVQLYVVVVAHCLYAGFGIGIALDVHLDIHLDTDWGIRLCMEGRDC